MRLRFREGKQRELIKEFKLRKKLTWKQLSDFLGIREGRLKAYVDETSLFTEEIYHKLDGYSRYNRFIFEKLDDNWGKKKGGFLSKGKTKDIHLPKDCLDFAEFFGIMLGDGNSHRTKAYKKGTYMIRIVGDARFDKRYLKDYVKPLIEGLFKINVRVGYFKGKNAMFIESHSVKLINFLESKGFPPGNKIKNKLRIPDWIKNNKRFVCACLRGLYDTDGSVYKLTNQNSHQICFTNYNQSLLADVRECLLSLGVNCSEISRRDIYITRKSELRKFLKLIGFNNDKHLNKVKMWKLNSPIV